MKFLNKINREKIISTVNKMRKEYIEDPQYAAELYDIFVQNLNIKSNQTLQNAGFSLDALLEYLSIYSKAADIHPELFAGRNIDYIQDSLQKSIYSSACTELAGNFISELSPNDPDSFLLIPIIFTLPDSSHTYDWHSCAFVVRKKESKILVETIDKAGFRPCMSEEEVKSKEFPDRCWINSESQEICINYTYEIPNTKENILKVAHVLRIGRVHFNNDEIKNIQINIDGMYYAPFKELNKFAEKKYYTNHIATMQYAQGNCGIKNINAALQYLFGTPKETGYVLPNGTKAIKIKYNEVTKEQLNSTIAQLISNHLVKTGYSSRVKKAVRSEYILYKQLKEGRSSATLKEKLQMKVEEAHILNRLYEGTENIKIPRSASASLINYSYDKQAKLSEKENKYIQDLNHLTKTEINEIKKRSKVLNEKKQTDPYIKSVFEFVKAEREAMRLPG